MSLRLYWPEDRRHMPSREFLVRQACLNALADCDTDVRFAAFCSIAPIRFGTEDGNKLLAAIRAEFRKLVAQYEA